MTFSLNKMFSLRRVDHKNRKQKKMAFKQLRLLKRSMPTYYTNAASKNMPGKIFFFSIPKS